MRPRTTKSSPILIYPREPIHYYLGISIWFLTRGIYLAYAWNISEIHIMLKHGIFSRWQPDGGTCKPSPLASWVLKLAYVWYSSISCYGKPKKAYAMVLRGNPRLVVQKRYWQGSRPSKKEHHHGGAIHRSSGMFMANEPTPLPGASAGWGWWGGFLFNNA